jgi:hypothetical protein
MKIGQNLFKVDVGTSNGYPEIFMKLVTMPIALQKLLKMEIIISTFERIDLRKTTTSSTYMEVLKFAPSSLIVK